MKKMIVALLLALLVARMATMHAQEGPTPPGTHWSCLWIFWEPLCLIVPN